MLSTRDLLKIAVARLRDADALSSAGRYDGAMDVGGYAVECALKARIVRAQAMPGFPESDAEFKPYLKLWIHKLRKLLAETDREAYVLATVGVDWLMVTTWDPTARYRRIGSVSQRDVRGMIDSTRRVLRAIWP